MVKFSLYLSEADVSAIDAAKDEMISAVGIKISRNAFIRSLLFHCLEGKVTISPDPDFKDAPNAQSAA